LRRKIKISRKEAACTRWFEMSIRRLPYGAGGAVVIRADVTECKSAQLDILRQKQQLICLERAALVGVLSGAFAHELHQPLTSMLCNAEAAVSLLACAPADLMEVREILQDIIQDSRRGAQIIDRLQGLLHRGKIARESINLNTLVDELLQFMRCELINRHAHVTTDLGVGLPNLRGDRVQLQQVLLNLLINACEAMAENLPADRKVLITTRLCDSGRSIEVAIADSGCGIAAGHLERVFQPFVTSKPEGLGLGLVICRWIAQAHRGRLWAEDAAGGGAVLRLRLPVRC
jgi:C4-dicarboxylate-specific signal transduction histidine kinase